MVRRAILFLRFIRLFSSSASLVRARAGPRVLVLDSTASVCVVVNPRLKATPQGRGVSGPRGQG